nr:MLO-like protein 4 isoform X1 [Ipomoea batatas]
MEETFKVGRSLEGTPTWSVASVITVMVFVCLFVERSIFRFGRWLKETRRKALYASLEKIKEAPPSSAVNSTFAQKRIMAPPKLFNSQSPGYCQITLIFLPRKLANYHHILNVERRLQGREPFVSAEGLEQLHRFLFVLAITHVLYSCIAVGLSMSKIYSWRKWENQVSIGAEMNLQAAKVKVMRRQSTFALHHASHPWSRSRVLIWMNHKLPFSYNFHKYMVRSMEDEFYEIVGISWPLWGYAIICIFVNIHGLNIYFWLSFIPVILVMVVGTKLQHVVSLLALEIAEPKGPLIGTQVKPRDGLFWFGKPEILLRLIQFISFQNAFEMATFIWSLVRISVSPLYNSSVKALQLVYHVLVEFLTLFDHMNLVAFYYWVLVQLWCSYSTVPLNVIISQMGSRCRKALIAESVRESLHSWCKRVRQKSKRGTLTTRSVCSLESTVDERDEVTTVASLTLSPCSSSRSLNALDEDGDPTVHPDQLEHDFPFREEHGAEDNVNDTEEGRPETLLQLFQKT